VTEGFWMDWTPASSAPDAVRHHDHDDRQRGPDRSIIVQGPRRARQ
jgi:hypothetical protein